MSTPGPVPVADLDGQMRRVLGSEHRSRWILTGISFAALTIAILALATGFVIHQRVQRLQDQAVSSARCAYIRDLTFLPLAPPSPGGRPSRFDVQIIADSRAAYVALGCPRVALPLTPAARQWAAYYHINPH